MTTETLDENVENMFKEETPQSEAVKSLIRIKDKEKGKLGSDVELKTDFKNEKIVCIHTGVDILAHILSMNPHNFKSTQILEQLTTLKERKLLSLERKSRKEIVEVARTPEMSMEKEITGGFVKNLFRSRKERF